MYDYFLKDHLGNIRLVLADQSENVCYPFATVEDATYTNEQLLYDIVNARRIDKSTTGATQSSFGRWENRIARVENNKS